LRYFFYLSYKGTHYHGWQIQPNANSVQAEVNKALAILFKREIETIGSGRTDTGVHATEQVFHADLPDSIEEETIMNKMIGLLPKDIVVNQIKLVSESAHARFDAIRRSYEYHIHFRRSPFHVNEYCYLPKKPDFETINKACQLIFGKHDFTSFSKVKTSVNNFNCQIEQAEWQVEDEKAIFYETANRFLRGMVRALVGTLLDVGYGKINIEEFKKILLAKDRRRAGQSVPPQGLYLCEVRYPETIFIK